MSGRGYIILLLFINSVATYAQQLKEPTAKFTFDNGREYDEINGYSAKLVGVYQTADRFGNENNAVYLSGNRSSYINLGNYKALKPPAGSISVWVKMEHPIWSGTGMFANPIIITKNCSQSDFYESYAIYYLLESKRLVVVCAQDSTRDIGAYSKNAFKRNEWQHVVMTFDDNFICLYLNSRLEGKFPKNFRIRYLDSDSVMVGASANIKNNRFFNGSIDDLAFYNSVLSQQEIEELFRAPNPNKYMIALTWVYIALGFCALIVAIYFLIKYRLSLAMKKERQILVQANSSLENELRVHRALMNPHFIFNSLNGLQDFILKNANEDAYDYLIKFSQLLRKILESNMSDFITLELEIELLKRYIEIEDIRFEENIVCTFIIDPALAPSVTTIPIMMLQPFIENAIWHGLLNKEGEKIINISFSLYNGHYVQCIIEDNGIGRKQVEPMGTEKKSMAINFIKQRLNLLNKIHDLHCSLVIEDKPGGQGTIVKIILPIFK